MVQTAQIGRSLAPVLDAQQLAACQNVRQALLDFGRASAATLAPLMQQIGQTAVSLHHFPQDAYDRAGKPYRDTPEGLHRWCQDAAEAQRQAQGWDWKPLT